MLVQIEHLGGHKIKPVTLDKPVPSIDIYATYRCNLRCKHCFLGSKLDLATHFDFELLQALINAAPQWKTDEITFLGGEPTLYPFLHECIRLVQKLNMKARIVTNGQKSFKRFIDSFTARKLPHVCFSVDGSSSVVHDAMRGKNAFKHLLQSISIANDKGCPTSGIVSLNRFNADDCEQTLELCETLGFQYVNVHYVTDRGFATRESVLTIDQWLALVRRIELKTKSINLDVRVERTFTPQTTFSGGCAVREQSNLMFFPDGRVYMCAMFIDVPNAHSYTWTRRGLVPNMSSSSERAACTKNTNIHCPAMAFVSPDVASQAEKQGFAVRCIYDKSCLRMGGETADTHSLHLPKRTDMRF